jgi:ribosomal protein S18 acetylase RimI-like enzyme
VTGSGQRQAVLEVRPAISADASAVAALWTKVFVEEAWGFDTPPFSAEAVLAIAERHVVHVVVKENSVIGAAALARFGAPLASVARANEVELRLLAVDQAARRSGVARELVEACAVLAARTGARALVLWSRLVQEPAHRLYTDLGFTRAPERDFDFRGDPRIVFTLLLQGYGSQLRVR